MTLDNALVLAASLTYLLATLVYGAYMLRFAKRLASAGLFIMASGAVLHLAAQAVRLGTEGIGLRTYDAFLFGSLILVGGWLLRQLKHSTPMHGAFLSPFMTMVLYSLHVFEKEGAWVQPAEIAWVTQIHIISSSLGFLVFGVAAVSAGLEMTQEYRLKTKRIVLGSRSRLPSLRKLEKITHRALLLGFPIYSVGVALGTVWFAKLDTPAVTRHLIMAAFSWVLYALLIHARISLGLKGRRAALITLAAFASSLFVVLLSVLRIGT
ncbi:MAG: ABC-type uncharacterized transport system permease subunit [Myxococcota bacterium]|jgi:ABC-type uncharacterized transport system permease subunit